MTEPKRDLGTLVQLGDRQAVRYERHYPHAPEKVWRALVEPEALAGWFPSAIEGERRAGAKLRFVFPNEEGPAMTGEFTVFDPPRTLEFTWGEDSFRFEISAERDGKSSRVIFTSTFAQRSSAVRDATGWHLCLDSLGSVLDGEKASDQTSGRFPDLYREYNQHLGLGDFPDFVVPPGEGSDGKTDLVLRAAGLEGRTFESGATRIAFLRATRDADVEEHLLEHEAYLCVIEGRYVLRLGGSELPLEAGTEFHVPGGGKVGGRFTRGTRIVYVTHDGK